MIYFHDCFIAQLNGNQNHLTFWNSKVSREEWRMSHCSRNPNLKFLASNATPDRSYIFINIYLNIILFRKKVVTVGKVFF